MASGISLVSFNSRPDGMHQRSYSVSSADQWSEATVIANSGISSGKTASFFLSLSFHSYVKTYVTYLDMVPWVKLLLFSESREETTK